MDSQSPDENIACQGCENVFTRIVGYELSCLACVEAVRKIQNSGILQYDMKSYSLLICCFYTQILPI